MEVYRTEEEQVEFIKRWWKNNGTSVLTGVALAVALTFGWQTYQQSKQSDADAASALFVQLQEAARAMKPVPEAGADKAAEDDPQRATFKHLAEQIKSEHAGSTYSVLTAMMLARDHVENADAAAAEKELRWALEQKPSEPMRLIISLRLARALAMKGDVDAALSLLNGIDPGAQKGAYEEVKGDLHLMKGDKDKARHAYQLALDALDMKASSKNLVQIKLNDLAVANP